MEPCMCVGLCFYLSASSRLSQIPCIYFCACSCIFLSLLYKEIPWRLEERIVIEPPFSPAETVSLSFCLPPPQPFVREKKNLFPWKEVLKSSYGTQGNGEVFREEGQLVRGRQGLPQFGSPWQSLSLQAVRSPGPAGVKGVPGRGGVLRSAWL